MLSFIFFISSLLVVSVMWIIFYLVVSSEECEWSSFSPLESGFSTVTKVTTVFSLQYFTTLVIFLVFDLEMVFVIGLMLGKMALSTGLLFWSVVILTLWLEWSWGKLLWLS